MKGKDMILSDFLSQQKNDDSDSSEIIPISFNAYRILEKNRKIDVCKNEEKFLIQMHSQAKTSGTTLLEVHGIRKELNPNLRPEKQHAMPKKGMTERPCIGQGRAGLRRKYADCTDQPFICDKKNFREIQNSKEEKQITCSIQNTMHDRGINNDKSFSPDVLLHPNPLRIPLPRQQNLDKLFPTNKDSGINLDIEENSPFQEGVISETITETGQNVFSKSKRLEDIIDMGNLIHKFLPKQTDIDKF